MGKKRRTRQEKIEAEKRQDFSQVFRISEIKLPDNKKHESQTNVVVNSPKSYTYVAKDIRYTLAVTAALLALNIALFFILKLNIVNILGIRL